MMRINRTMIVLAVGLLATTGGLAAVQGAAHAAGQRNGPAPMQATVRMYYQGGSMLNRTDRAFLHAANEANLAEIKTSQMALNRATGQNYRDFAQHMIDDHTSAENDLRELAQSKGVTLPDDPGAKNRAVAARLDRLSGAHFDADYWKIQNSGHIAAIALFKREIRYGRDADIKAYAEKYLPKIEEHHKMLIDMGDMTHSGRL